MPKPLALPVLHVVQVFDLVEDRLTPGRRTARPSADAARRLAEDLAPAHAGVIAWSQAADPATGDYGAREILFRAGRTP